MKIREVVMQCVYSFYCFQRMCGVLLFSLSVTAAAIPHLCVCACACVCMFVLSVLRPHVCKSSNSHWRSRALSISQPQLSHTGVGTVSYRTHTDIFEKL